MGWLRLVGSLKLQVSLAKEPYKRDDILQKRPIILRSLLFVATPYADVCVYYLRFAFVEPVLCTRLARSCVCHDSKRAHSCLCHDSRQAYSYVCHDSRQAHSCAMTLDGLIHICAMTLDGRIHMCVMTLDGLIHMCATTLDGLIHVP